MRTISILIGAALMILIATKVSAEPAKTCKIVTGYGTAIGHGATPLEAKEKARLICGTKLIDQYFAQRQAIPEDRKDDLALACVNLECQ